MNDKSHSFSLNTNMKGNFMCKQEQMTFTIHKWELMILWFAHFQDWIRTDCEWMGNVVHLS